MASADGQSSKWILMINILIFFPVNISGGRKKKKKTIIELFNDKHFVITTGTVIPEAKNSTKPNIYSHAQYSEVHAKCNMLQC